VNGDVYGMSVCKYCEGTGKLGFQQEGCCYCGGSGYIKEKIVLDKRTVENGLNKLVEIQLKITEKLNNQTAYTKEECKEKLKLFEEQEQVEYILHYLFDLQSFQYVAVDYDGVTIR